MHGMQIHAIGECAKLNMHITEMKLMNKNIRNRGAHSMCRVWSLHKQWWLGLGYDSRKNISVN